MPDDTVIAFPKQRQTYEDWRAWAECELAILGFEIKDSDYDWEAAFERGMKPEDAAAEAADAATSGDGS